MEKECAFYKKKFECNSSQHKVKYCSNKCCDLAYYYRNKEKKQKYARDYSSKNYIRDKEKRQKRFKNWYKNEENKEKQKRLVSSYYYKNKKRWKERAYTNKHREKILEFLPNNCIQCSKEEIKIIHHKTYNFKKRKMRPTQKEVLEYLKYYVKFLLPFCSIKCHREYEKKQN